MHHQTTTEEVISSTRIETHAESHCRIKLETTHEGLIRILQELTATHNDSLITRIQVFHNFVFVRSCRVEHPELIGEY